MTSRDDANRHARDYYARDPKRQQARNKAGFERKQAEVRAQKEAVPCADCKKRFPHYVMDFDHVHGEKLGNISTMIFNGASMARIQAEIDKCEVVCSNCHRARTWERLQEPDGS